MGDNKLLKFVINQTARDLINDLSPDQHIIVLQENNVLTDRDMEDIKGEKTRSQKVETLLNILKRKYLSHIFFPYRVS